LVFTSPIAISKDCSIQIDIPVALATNLQTKLVKTQINNSTVSFNINGSTINAKLVSDLNGQVNLTLNQLQLPDSVRETEAFLISIKDINGRVLAESKSLDFKIKADSFDPGSMVVQLSAQNTTNFSKNDLTFNLQQSATITVGAQVLIEFPSVLLLNTDCTITPLTN
jgi:hypothetical protein